MRVIKLAAISIVVLFAVITVISFFIPPHIRISRAIDINAPAESLMQQIGEPVHWKDWYPVEGSSQPFYAGSEIKGIRLDSVNAVVISGKTDSTITAEFTPAKKKIKTVWVVMGNGNSSVVQWYMDFHLGWYPWEKFKSLLFDKIYGSQMEKGLANLKTIAER